MNTNTITGILLAGGKSKRMGTEKGMIPLGECMLYQYPLRVLESFTDTILISTCKPLEIPEKYEQVCDEIPGIGPMGGLYTCLKQSQSELNMVLPYDLPMVNSDLFRHLLRYTNDFDVVIPAAEPGKQEPLCGIYKKSALTAMKEMIDEENYAIHQLLPRVRSRVLVMDPSLPFYHEMLFSNVNTQADLAGILPMMR